MTYNHTGIPVYEKTDNMVFIESLKVWITDAASHPYKIEYLYFEPDSPMAAAIQDETHVAYVVDDIEAAVAGKSILWPICQPAPTMKIAFIYDEGLPVELIQLI
ncbi:MAG: hypothetical protein IJU44_09860 [Kiritimatiellae bacterium]|nr:hypothetical protein [Kiritimatiellia bacterium]